MTETTYEIRRFYSDERRSEVVTRGQTLEQARAHCNRDDTHGQLADGTSWFDGYTEEEGGE